MTAYPFPENLLRRLRLNGSCVEFTGCTDRGYGLVRTPLGVRKAHRVMWELMVGPIPDGKVLDHLCRNRGCVNPAHLEVVTQGENVLRGIGPVAVNARKTHCKNGHEFTEENTIIRREGWRGCRTCSREYPSRLPASVGSPGGCLS